MKLRLRYTFAETEEDARTFCDRENAEHPRRKNRAHYTPWSSADNHARFIVWYYTR